MDKRLLPELVNRSWLEEPSLKHVMQVLNPDGEETRLIGGAVRDALLGEAVSDIDLATTATPEIVKLICQHAGLKTVDSGIEHGTITVISGQNTFEVTTLREDIETDGRHASVLYGRDWTQDAKRRDFTMNALSIDENGTVHDPIGGYEDLVHNEVKFIGEAKTRIKEDYLRILRFFRFFAWYGKGRPDRDALRAIIRTKDGLKTLSAERVWSEWKKLLQAPLPERSILWMRTAEVLPIIMPENWGLDQFHWLINAEKDQDWNADALLRLQAMMRPASETVQAIADRLKMSNAERGRLLDWANESANAASYVELSSEEFAKVLYRGKPSAIQDALHHEYAKRLNKDEEGRDSIRDQLHQIENWQRPVFPLSGDDLIKKGENPGPSLGQKLRQIEERWIESGFSLSRNDLLS